MLVLYQKLLVFVKHRQMQTQKQTDLVSQWIQACFEVRQHKTMVECANKHERWDNVKHKNWSPKTTAK